MSISLYLVKFLLNTDLGEKDSWSGRFEETPNKNHPSYSLPCMRRHHPQFNLRRSFHCFFGLFLKITRRNSKNYCPLHKTSQNRVQMKRVERHCCTRPCHSPIDRSKGRKANRMYKGDAILLKSTAGVNILMGNQPIVPLPMHNTWSI